MQEQSVPSVPRKASTLVLVRPGHAGAFEVFMTRRPREMRFLGGFFVFPGGAVKGADGSPAMLDLCRGLSPADARARLGNDLSAADAMGHWVAAIRELYEEVGVLLCVVPADGAGAPPSRTAGRFSAADGDRAVPAQTWRRVVERRTALLGREVSFPELLASEGLCCDAGRLVYFYHRTTPERYAMRFDTRFFLAALPEGQTPLEVSEEVTESLWITPAAGLQRAERGRMAIIPPTLATLRTLAELGTWDALCRDFALPPPAQA